MSVIIKLLQTTLGAMEIGVCIGAVLIGIHILQVFLYFRNFPRDPWGLKTLVASVFILDVVHSVVLIQTLFHYTIDGFGILTDFDVTFSYCFSFILEIIIIYLVQGFFAYRIYKVTGSKIITSICVSLDTARVAFATIAVVEAFRIRSFVAYGEVRRWQIVVFAALAASSDALNAATLCTTLVRSRSGVSKRTDKLIDKVIMYTISSGLLTSMVTLSSLICYMVMENFIWLALLTITSKLFTNSLLASLNARTSIQNGYTDQWTVNIGQNTFLRHAPVRVEMETIPTSDGSTIPTSVDTKMHV